MQDPHTKLREAFKNLVIDSNAHFFSNISAKQADEFSDFWLNVLSTYIEGVREEIAGISHTDEYKRTSDEYFAYGNALNKVLSLPSLSTKEESHE